MKILKVEEIKKEGILTLFTITYLNKKGKEKKWNLFSRGSKERLENELFKDEVNCDGVAIYAIHKPTNKLVLLKEFRIAVNKDIYTLPAGIIDKNEDAYIAAKRELKEETGLNIINYDYSKSAIPRHSAIGLTNEQVCIVYCECDGELKPEMDGDNEKGIPFLVDEEEVKRILREEKIAGRTEIILQNYLYQCENQRLKALVYAYESGALNV